MSGRIAHIIKKTFLGSIRILLWIIGSVLLLVMLIIAAFHIPSVQNFAAQKAVSFLSEKLDTKVSLGKIFIGLPKSIRIENFYLEDQEKDTLVYAGLLEVDINLPALFSKRLEVGGIRLENASAKIKRTLPDSSFNFDFIVKAFIPKDTSASVPKDTSATAMQMAVDDVSLKNVRFSFLDETSGNDVKSYVGELEMNVEEFDPAKMIFQIGDLEMKNSYASIVQSKSSPPDTDSIAQPLPQLGYKNITLENVRFSFHQEIQKLKADVRLGYFNSSANQIDLNAQYLDLESIKMENSSVNLSVFQKGNVDGQQKAQTDPGLNLSAGWQMKLGSINFRNNNLIYNNTAVTEIPKGFDANHLKLAGLSFSIKNINIKPEEVSAKILSLSFKEDKEFSLQNLSAQILLNDKNLEVKNLDLKTPYSKISRNFKLDYPSLAEIGKDISQLGIYADMGQSEIGFHDILYLQPVLENTVPFKNNRNTSVYISGLVNGKVSDLDLKNFRARALNNSSIHVDGKITGLPDINKIWADVHIRNLQSSRSDLNTLLKGSLPSNIKLPVWVKADGHFRGKMNDLDAQLKMSSSQGTASIDMKVRPGAGRNKEIFESNIAVRKYNVGELISNPDIGTVTMIADVDGVSLNPDSIEAKMDLLLQEAVYKKYAYKNFSMQGFYHAERFIGTASIKDSNIVFDFDGEIDLGSEIPKYSFKFDLDGADFQALNITKDDFRAQGSMSVNLEGSDLNNLNGDLRIQDVLFVKHNKQYPVDSLLLISISEEKNKSISIVSDFFSASFKGSISLGDLPTVLRQHMATYFKQGGGSISPALKQQHFNFWLRFHNTAMLTDLFIPDLEEFNPGIIRGKYNSDAKNLELDVHIPRIKYAGIGIDSLILDVNSNKTELDYSMRIDQTSFQNYYIQNIGLFGLVEKDTVDINFVVEDGNGQEKFFLAGDLTSLNDVYRFTFLPNGVVFNYTSWKVSEDNLIRISPAGLYVNNVEMTHEGQRLYASHSGNQPSSPLNLNFKDFNLSYFTSLLSNQQSLLNGVLNGNVTLKGLTTERFAFNAELGINEFSFQGDTLGNITVKSDNETQNRYSVFATIKGKGNDISTDGYYAIGGENPLNFDIKINKMNLATVESYSMGQLSKMGGDMSGQLSLKGSSTKPLLTGALHFDNARLTLSYLNCELKLINENLILTENSIDFKNFILRDAENHPMSVNGNISHTYLTDYKFNLDVKMTNFLVMNTVGNDSMLYYGTAYVDNDIKVRGTLDRPVVVMNTRLNDGSSLSMALPEQQFATVESEGIVEWEDFSKKYNAIMDRQKFIDTSSSDIKGIDLTMYIQTTRKSDLKVIVDRAAGDSLVVRGDATLNFSLDPGGKMTMTGRYEIAEGSYQLTMYDFVRRRFQIEPGSSLIWTGDPMNATVDISAVYKIKTSPLDLMEGITEQERNTYRNKVPFLVYLNMKGELLKPTIDFDIKLPNDQRAAMGGAVDARLMLLNENESEVNKQVFALLILGRFVAEDPFGGSEDGGIASTARTSASKVLTQQLNKFAGMIDVVDINLNVESYEDYSSGQAEGRTEVQIGVAKSFANDRVTVQVGGNVDVEGDRNRQQKGAASDFGGDVSAEYKITEDGRYRLRAFRENEYEGILEGEIIETGVGLVFIRDYDNIRNLFKKTKEEKEEQRRNKAK